MNLSDRIALILGRAIIRAEELQTALDEANRRLADLEAQKPATDQPKP